MFEGSSGAKNDGCEKVKGKNVGGKSAVFGKNGKRCQMQIDSFQYQFQNNRRTAREGNEMPARAK